MHAKLYVAKQGKQVSWYIGSANCTNPAMFDRNIEFLTAITSSGNNLATPQELLLQLTEADQKSQGIFIEYEKTIHAYNKEAEQLEMDLRKTIFDISTLKIKTSVTENEQKLFNYQLQITPPVKIVKRESWQVFVQPLSGMKGPMQEVENKNNLLELCFEDYEMHRLTPYFLFTLKEGATVLKTLVLKLDIDFPEGRMKKIFSSLVGDWQKLMKYLSFLLSKEQVERLIDLTDDGDSESRAQSSKGWQEQFPLYEKLLVAASRDVPSLLRTIKVVEMLADETDVKGNLLIEDSFKKLIQTFKEIIPNDN